ncbi:hypothetical protein GJAV_G00216790 [Gymnothorax javanicus]|nr:hypothetical protein GJAV_G00216790 [Gymnothorax javanicus]
MSARFSHVGRSENEHARWISMRIWAIWKRKTAPRNVKGYIKHSAFSLSWIFYTSLLICQKRLPLKHTEFIVR